MSVSLFLFMLGSFMFSDFLPLSENMPVDLDVGLDDAKPVVNGAF